MQQSFNQPPPPPPIQPPQQSYSISTVTKEYNKNQQQQQQQQQKYPSSTLPYKKPGTGFTETSSILKKHREEINDLKPQNIVYRGADMQQQQQQQYQQYSDTPRSNKQISILNQPLPEIPQPNDIKLTDKSLSSSNQQVLCASNLNNYRSLQRPTLSKLSTSQKSKDISQKSSTSVKVAPPILPPKNRQKDDKNYRPPQPLPSSQKSYNNSYNTQQQQQQQYSQSHQSNPPISKSNYDRDRDRERDRPTKDRDRSSGRSHDDYNSQQFKSSSKLKNMQTLPTNHHHHYPSSFIKNPNMDANSGMSAMSGGGGGGGSSSSKSNRKSIESQHSDRRNQSYSSKSQHRNSSGSKDYSNHHHSHTDYSATEL